MLGKETVPKGLKPRIDINVLTKALSPITQILSQKSKVTQMKDWLNRSLEKLDGALTTLIFNIKVSSKIIKLTKTT